METAGVTQCLELGKLSRSEAKTAKNKIEGLDTLREGEKLGCAKRVGFEEGIPLHKIRALHFWLGARHPIPCELCNPFGRERCIDECSFYIVAGELHWMVGRFRQLLPRCVTPFPPADHSAHPSDRVGADVEGYHLEHCRHVKSAKTHLPRAFILGKRPQYFSEEKYAWPRDALERMTREIGGDFEFVGGAGRKGIDEMPMKGITNLGSMKREEWNDEVAQSALMVSQRCDSVRKVEVWHRVDGSLELGIHLCLRRVSFATLLRRSMRS